MNFVSSCAQNTHVHKISSLHIIIVFLNLLHRLFHCYFNFANISYAHMHILNLYHAMLIYGCLIILHINPLTSPAMLYKRCESSTLLYEH
jgi:hypothetical protein